MASSSPSMSVCRLTSHFHPQRASREASPVPHPSPRAAARPKAPATTETLRAALAEDRTTTFPPAGRSLPLTSIARRMPPSVHSRLAPSDPFLGTRDEGRRPLPPMSAFLRACIQCLLKKYPVYSWRRNVPNTGGGRAPDGTRPPLWHCQWWSQSE